MSTPALGLGACPCGSVPAGFGTPASLDTQPRNVLTCADGTQGNAALLDYTSGDYVIDQYGHKVGCDSLQQRVYLALVTVLGSAADTTLGTAWPAGTITPDLPQRNEAAVRAALKRLTDAKLVQVVAVITTPFAPTGRQVQVTWRSLVTGAVFNNFA